MSRRPLSLLIANLLLVAIPATASDWKITAAANGQGETMALAIDTQRSYIVECTSNAIALTYIGATDLLDLKGNGKVADEPGSVMPEGAALMAVYAGKGDPQFVPAEYKPNATKGWDLTLRLSKDAKALKDIEKAKTLSLFTTGYTAAIELDPETRAQFKSFFERCRS